MSGRKLDIPAGVVWAPVPIELVRTRSSQAVRVWAELHNHGQTAETCYPSHDRLAELLGVNRRTVLRAIDELASHGWVRVVRRSTGQGRTSNGYDVHYTGGVSTSEQGPCSPADRGDTSVTSAVTSVSDRCDSNVTARCDTSVTGTRPNELDPPNQSAAKASRSTQEAPASRRDRATQRDNRARAFEYDPSVGRPIEGMSPPVTYTAADQEALLAELADRMATTDAEGHAERRRFLAELNAVGRRGRR